LSSDAFQGRGPGERGETMTLAYLRSQFEAAGLVPGGPNGSWFQDVPLVRVESSERQLVISVGGADLPLQQTRDWSLSGSHAGQASIADAPLVFVGFGIHAPELGWDDYAGLDVRGKIVVMLPNDPDFDQPEGPFGGYARSKWARGKAAAALERGAAGIITIHRTALTSWPWQQIANSDSDPSSYRRQATPAPRGMTRLNAWLTDSAAAVLFNRAGMNLEAAIRSAQQKGFRGFDIPARLTGSVVVTETPIITRNILARLDGTSRAAETVLIGAHWDGYGVGPADATGDRIRNAAIDNGVGTATLLELARAFARAPRTQRSLLFIGYTAEEDGLLGAYEYVANPVRPLDTTAAVFNLDPHLALSQTRSVELIGAGRTPLEQDLARLAAAQGRVIEAEADPSAGWYFRSDHYAFAEAGVPTVYFRAGRDLVNGGSAEGSRQVSLYNSQCYHQRCDEFQESWDMAAAAQDGALTYAFVREIADSGRWPEWNSDSEFRALRERSSRSRR
jgi:Zn-dependent M28 family amino/carboxypeptidase